ncbi:PTS sugar transporter subunit IIA [Streptomyces sp. YIM S03343]
MKTVFQRIDMFAVAGEAESGDAAIRLGGEFLHRQGDVGESFAQECVDRERDYPTGLLTSIPVAIPHCRSDAIFKDAVCYVRLRSAVTFRRMDDDEKAIETRSVFVLAVKDGNDHVDFLSRTIRVITDPELMQRLESMEIGDVPAFLERSYEMKG